MTQTPTSAQSALPAVLGRPAPAAGGFSIAIIGLEVRRLVRNRRTLFFTLIAPVVFFVIFGLGGSHPNQRSGDGNEAAFFMISMALYGAVLATTSTGAMVSIERAAGWSRQLRLTPISPIAYTAMKMLSALALGIVAVAAVYAVGAITGRPSMPIHTWIITAGCVWIGSLLFAAFGLWIGYLLPSENVMQLISFAMVLFSFGGGLFIPLSQASHTLRTIAPYTPLYGLNQLVHYPLIGGSVHATWVINLILWLAIFTGGAAWRLRGDTSRV